MAGCAQACLLVHQQSPPKEEKAVTGPIISVPQKAHQIRGNITMPDPGSHVPNHIALFMPSLGGGGVERVMLNVASAFMERGARVDLVVCRAEGSFRDRVPAQLNVVALRAAPAGWTRFLILTVDPKGLKTLLRPVLLPLNGSGQFRHLSDL